MSSQLAQEKHFGGMACYRASEGKVVEVPYKGSAESVIQEILGGIRSTMSYIGARRLKDIAKCTTFYRVNRQLNKYSAKVNTLILYQSSEMTSATSPLSELFHHCTKEQNKNKYC